MRIASTLAVLLVPAVAGASLFHLALKRAEPAQGATVHGAPTALRLWFTEAPEVAVTKVRLTLAKDTVAVGTPALDTSAGKPIVVPIPRALGPGAYTVHWSTMSRDGHPVKGSYGFTVAR